MLIFSAVYGLYVALPWLAPVLMHIGWVGAARVIYGAYAWVCHQMPQRSFFLFGPQKMYTLPQIQAAWQVTTDPAVLRQFVGNPAMGWKVAWSDRMVSLYTGLLLAAWLWYPLQKRLRPLPTWVFLLLLLPLGVDGTTHWLSDFLFGIGQGFRYTNAWLATLTNGAFPDTFYTGNALGSFNSWMRLLSGMFFSVGLVGWMFPRLGEPQEGSPRPAASAVEADRV